MDVVTRFAPSPTGRIHVGNIRTALLSWLWARKCAGRFLLRLDDTDAARSTEAFAKGIRDDLAWLGLVPDGEARQSARAALYEERFAVLRAAGRVYPAYETPEELALRRKVLLGRGLPPVYDRAALALDAADHARLAAEGKAPHWRFRLDHGAPIGWDDLIRGPQRFDPALLSDPVVRRADGSWLYLLPSVIDDIAMGISHVVRGEDHVSNTALQLQMFDALGAVAPAFAHAALLIGEEGKLSKRLGALDCDDFRGAGIEPQALLALLARLGTSDPVAPVAHIAELAGGFDFARLGRAPARFDMAELERLNGRTLHLLPYAAVAGRLPAALGEAGWRAIRGNLGRVDEGADWSSVVSGSVAPPLLENDDGLFVARAADVAAALDWDDGVWAALTDALRESTGRKGRALFLPLRRALTGRGHGPDMAALLPLIGRERALARLRAAAAG